jgi:hypothetical protein
MAVSSAEVLKGYHNLARAVGDKSVNSDAFFVIQGYEQLGILIKQFPWPTLGVGGEIEIALPGGSKAFQSQQANPALQGQVTFTETSKGHVHKFLLDILKKGGKFNATVYEGTPDRFHYAKKIVDCFFQPDQGDRDWENRSQITTVSGTLFFHYFGDDVPGNIL